MQFFPYSRSCKVFANYLWGNNTNYLLASSITEYHSGSYFSPPEQWRHQCPMSTDVFMPFKLDLCYVGIPWTRAQIWLPWFEGAEFSTVDGARATELETVQKTWHCLTQDENIVVRDCSSYLRATTLTDISSKIQISILPPPFFLREAVNSHQTTHSTLYDNMNFWPFREIDIELPHLENWYSTVGFRNVYYFLNSIRSKLMLRPDKNKYAAWPTRARERHQELHPMVFKWAISAYATFLIFHFLLLRVPIGFNPICLTMIPGQLLR
jgi:hypothetical protein